MLMNAFEDAVGGVELLSHVRLCDPWTVFSHHFSNETQVTCFVVNTSNINAGEGIFSLCVPPSNAFQIYN